MLYNNGSIWPGAIPGMTQHGAMLLFLYGQIRPGKSYKAIVYNNNRRNRLAIKKTGRVYWPVKA